MRYVLLDETACHDKQLERILDLNDAINILNKIDALEDAGRDAGEYRDEIAELQRSLGACNHTVNTLGGELVEWGRLARELLGTDKIADATLRAMMRERFAGPPTCGSNT